MIETAQQQSKRLMAERKDDYRDKLLKAIHEMVTSIYQQQRANAQTKPKEAKK